MLELQRREQLARARKGRVFNRRGRVPMSADQNLFSASLRNTPPPPRTSYYPPNASTLATDTTFVCEIETLHPAIPRSRAISPARPLITNSGRPDACVCNATSCQVIPHESPVPKAFNAASLAANLAASRWSSLESSAQSSNSRAVNTRSKNRPPCSARIRPTRATSMMSTP